MRVIDNSPPLVKLSNKVMNLAVKAYYMSNNQKDILKVRQAQDILLDKLKEMSDPKTIHELDREAMRLFLNEKIKKGLKK